MSTITEFLLARIAEDEEEAARMGCAEYYDGGWSSEHEVHVRKECAAKRAILNMHGPARDTGWRGGEDSDHLWCTMCGSIDDSPVAWPCDTLKALATVYADHPDYQQRWAL